MTPLWKLVWSRSPAARLQLGRVRVRDRRDCRPTVHDGGALRHLVRGPARSGCRGFRQAVPRPSSPPSRPSGDAGLGERRNPRESRAGSISTTGWPQCGCKGCDIIANAAFSTAALFAGASLAQIALAFFAGPCSAGHPGSALGCVTFVSGFLAASVFPVAAAGSVVAPFVYAWRVSSGGIVDESPAKHRIRPPALACRLPPSLPSSAPRGRAPGMRHLGTPVPKRGTHNVRGGLRCVCARTGQSKRRVVCSHVARSDSPPLVSATVTGLATSMSACLVGEPLFPLAGSRPALLERRERQCVRARVQDYAPAWRRPHSRQFASRARPQAPRPEDQDGHRGVTA